METNAFDHVRRAAEAGGVLDRFSVVRERRGNGFAALVVDDGAVQIEFYTEHGQYFVSFAPSIAPDEWVLSDYILRILTGKGDGPPLAGRDLQAVIAWLGKFLSQHGTTLRHMFSREALSATRKQMESATRVSIKEQFGIDWNS